MQDEEKAKEHFMKLGEDRSPAKEERRIGIHCLAGLGR